MTSFNNGDHHETQMHIPEFTIKGFRRLCELTLPELGRVSLISGKNRTGKTTILEALEIFSSRGDDQILFQLLQSREELLLAMDENGDELQYPDFLSLFHKTTTDEASSNPTIINIDAGRTTDNLQLELIDAEENQAIEKNRQTKALKVTCGKVYRAREIGEMKNGKPFIKIVRRLMPNREKTETWPNQILCQSLGPGMLSNDLITKLWDNVVIESEENFVIETLRLIVGENLEKIMSISGGYDLFRGYPLRAYSRSDRRLIAKLTTQRRPIPLKRLGDGVQRLLGIAVALANCQNGILLIDEVENGIHYSLQEDLWRMIFTAAKKRNVQVVAATHSWDCINGFAKAANESNEVGILYRLNDNNGKIIPVQYSEEELEVAAAQTIEVR